MTGVLTVIAQVSATSPHVAVITQDPKATAVTTPFSSTVATSSLLDCQVRVSVTSSGYTVAIRRNSSPNSSIAESRFSTTESAKIS